MHFINKFTIIFALASAAVIQGTNVHANDGCILVANTPICAPGSVSVDSGSATIYARFNGGDSADQYVTAGCRLDATWPSDYGDIYFGADNCLYDSHGQNIGGQCCDVRTGGSQLVLNPYYRG
ncbi:hypothetical protein H0H92_004618 [Tricholoma furcatifolium]|nr:hypothetical protein H0H92_004618 [Tricholoma furcatifolium]